MKLVHLHKLLIGIRFSSVAGGCRGRAPDKSTVKRRFRASVTMRCCNTNVRRHCGTLATFALAAEWFPLVSLFSAAFASLEIARQFHATDARF